MGGMGQTSSGTRACALPHHLEAPPATPCPEAGFRGGGQGAKRKVKDWERWKRTEPGLEDAGGTQAGDLSWDGERRKQRRDREAR